MSTIGLTASARNVILATTILTSTGLAAPVAAQGTSAAVASSSVRETPHALEPGTKGFTLSDHGKDIFFTVTDPDYRKPKGTLLYFHGQNEFSELMQEQISQWTRAGYRVVTMDMPGAGLSSKDAAVGTRRLSHLNSIDEPVDAAMRVIDYVQNTYRDTQNGRLHFVTNNFGLQVAARVVEKLPAGAVSSVTAFDPIFDLDKPKNLDSSSRIKGGFTSAVQVDTAFTDKIIGYLEGDALMRKQLDFFLSDPLHDSRGRGRLTTGYTGVMAGEMDRLHPERDDWFYNPFSKSRPKFAEILESTGTSFAMVYDPSTELVGDAASEWNSHFKVGAKTTLLGGAGMGVIHNPDYAGQALSAIEANVSGCLFVKVANTLKGFNGTEWDSVPESVRRTMQQDLVAMGYDVGPHGMDGVVRHGAMADTEHALTQFTMTYLDLLNREADISDLLASKHFTPAIIAEQVHSARLLGFRKPTERELRLDSAFDAIQKHQELDHGDDGHHLAAPDSGSVAPRAPVAPPSRPATPPPARHAPPPVGAVRVSTETPAPAYGLTL